MKHVITYLYANRRMARTISCPAGFHTISNKEQNTYPSGGLITGLRGTAQSIDVKTSLQLGHSTGNPYLLLR